MPARRAPVPGSGCIHRHWLSASLESIGLLALVWLKERRVLEWLVRRRPTAHDLPEPEPTGVASLRSGPSTPLHKYLADRYADTVVLTFAEIEDLIGLALPARARLNTDWWTAPDPDVTRSRFADAWIQARRTARPNLQARTVTFDRNVA